ncbi:MAG: ATP-binding protein [Trebonia sp.]
MPSTRAMDAITLPASLVSLERVAGYVCALARQANLPENAAYRLRLATDEIVSNIILHGYKGNAGEIQVRGGVEEDQVWLRVADQAPPFDPRTVRNEPCPDAPVKDIRPGGLGLYLTRLAVDRFTYEFADGSNVNTIAISSRDDAGAA